MEAVETLCYHLKDSVIKKCYPIGVHITQIKDFHI